MSSKIRVGLIFGGRSGEHDVSLMSARSILTALDPDRYDVHLIGIDRVGRWHVAPLDRALSVRAGAPLELDERALEVALAPGSSALVPARRGEIENGARRDVDVFFPVVHGPYGEDGTLQGLLEMAGVPYVGCGVLGSAVGMDKDVAKRLLRDAGLPILDYVVVRSKDLGADLRRRVETELGFPCFVKPANLGSSVGVHKVKTPEDLDAAVEDALRFDRKVLVERAVDARELECAVLGNHEPEASIVGEIVPNAEFYSYEAKYLDENGAALLIPAPLTPEQSDSVRRLALHTFVALELEGMARVDFFLDKASGSLFVNEVNTIPGFTQISMYPKLWEASGMGYGELVRKLVDLALERHRERAALATER